MKELLVSRITQSCRILFLCMIPSIFEPIINPSQPCKNNWKFLWGNQFWKSNLNPNNQFFLFHPGSESREKKRNSWQDYSGMTCFHMLELLLYVHCTRLPSHSSSAMSTHNTDCTQTTGQIRETNTTGGGGTGRYIVIPRINIIIMKKEKIFLGWAISRFTFYSA